MEAPRTTVVRVGCWLPRVCGERAGQDPQASTSCSRTAIISGVNSSPSAGTRTPMNTMVRRTASSVTSSMPARVVKASGGVSTTSGSTVNVVSRRSVPMTNADPSSNSRVLVSSEMSQFLSCSVALPSTAAACSSAASRTAGL
ncbi:hypothetical protein [Ornithinimicrobium kibberense]|uniref:hypothetical protein n=1 Tax=Ornithinimicrobium kibberense TaxID=282060 RepID=UPI0036107D36